MTDVLGAAFTMSIAEPWDFESDPGENELSGTILGWTSERPQRLLVRALVVVAAGMLLFACSDGEESSPSTPSPVPTTALQADLERAKAQRIVLGDADLPGYTVIVRGPRDEKGPDIEKQMDACLGSSPLLVGLGQDDVPRGALGTDFEKGDQLTVSSAVTFAETEDDAKAAITELNAPSLPDCFAKATADRLGRDRTFENLRVATERLPVRPAGDQTIAYQTVVRTTLVGTPVIIFLDHTFIRSGRAVAILEATSVRTEFPPAERERLTAVLGDRLARS